MIKKKVLFVCTWFPNSTNKTMGIFIKKHAQAIHTIAELTTVALTIQPSKKIYNCQVIHKLDCEVGELLHIEINSRFWKFLTYSLIFQSFLVRRKMKMLQPKKFDLVQSNVLFMSGILGLKLSRKFNLPLIHVEHWSGFTKFIKTNIYKNYGKRVIQKATKVVCVSEFLKGDISGHVPLDKVVVIPNVVDSNFYPAIKSSSNKIRFLAIGNWKEPKNPLLFIEALSHLNEKYKNFELTMIGRGKFIAEIKSLELSYTIHFVDFVSNDLIQNYFENCDYFLHASNYETFSIVPIESIMTGTPVLVSRVGVLPEIINAQNGHLCDNNLEDWICKIELSIQKKYSVFDVSNSIGDQFNEKNVAFKFKELYETI
jgi:glycosyltransferase involved in cell wall biosynthesis